MLKINNKEIVFEKGINLIIKLKKKEMIFSSMNDYEIFNIKEFYEKELKHYDDNIFENNYEFVKKQLINKIKLFMKNKNKFIIIFSDLDEYIDIFNESIFESLNYSFYDYYLIISVDNVFKLNKNILKSVDNLIVGKLPKITKRYLKKFVN